MTEDTNDFFPSLVWVLMTVSLIANNSVNLKQYNILVYDFPGIPFRFASLPSHTHGSKIPYS